MAVKNIIVINCLLWFFWIDLGFFQKSLQAQSYIADVQKISVEDGLSNRFVNTVFEDSQGFVWIATQYGLNRYDGYGFKKYTKENSDIASNDVIDIHEDKDNKLWLLHSDAHNIHKLYNVDIIDLQTYQLQSFEELFEDIVPFDFKKIKFIYSDTEKNIWISTIAGTIYRYRDNVFELIFSLPEGFPEVIYVNKQYLWLYKHEYDTDKKELLKVDKKGKVLHRICLGETAIHRVGVDQDGTFWFFEEYEKDILQFTGKQGGLESIDLHSLGLPENSYAVNRPDKTYRLNSVDNLIWYGDDLGNFFVFHPQEGLIIDLQSQITPLLTFSNALITGMYFGSGNRTWVVTQDGLFIITLNKNKFSTLLSDVSKSYSTRGITEDNQGRIYINTYDGRMSIDPESGEIRRVEEMKHIKWLGASKDRYGNLWYSEYASLIEKYDPIRKQSQYYSKTDNLPWSQWAIMRDSTGRVWTGAHRGLYFLEPKTGIYKKFKQHNAWPMFEESTVYHMFEGEGGIWLTTSSGLYFLELGKGLTTRYAVEENHPFHIPYNDLLHSHRDKAGVFWLATKGGGLVRFDPNTGQYQQFTVEDGLSSDIIYAVYEDDYGKLWLPGNYGLIQFDKENHRAKTYLVDDGIAHNEFNTISHYRASDGRFYFGGLAGVTVFDPKDFRSEDSLSTPLRMTSFKVLNGKTGELMDKTIEISTLGQVKLSPSNKSFTVEFALLNYKGSQENRYAYKIEGLDKEWTTLRENSFRINALPYGSYVMRIKGQGTKGQWSGHELAIPIHVSKPFYLKIGFILGCIFMLVLLVYGVFRWRLYRLEQAKIRLQEKVNQRTREISWQKSKIEQQAEKLRELDKVKTRFFANISHELRTPLTLILGPLSMLIASLKSKEKEDTKKIAGPLGVMQRNGKQLLCLIEEILDLSKLEAHKLEIKESPVTLYPFIKRLFAAFESHATQRNIHYQLYYGPTKGLCLSLDVSKLEKIINNLLSNAFKYSTDGALVSLKVTIENTFIRIEIKDSGRGIHPSDLPHIFDRFYQSKQADAKIEGGVGIGLALCKELITVMGGQIQVVSEWGEGSTFSFTFPKKEIPTSSSAIQKKVRSVETTLKEVEISGKIKKTSISTENKLKKEYTILIVEDHDDMRGFIVETLEEHYHILTASDGEKALTVLKEKGADLVLSDVMMPRMDGFTLLEKVKSNQQWHSTPMMLLTARAAQEDRLQALTIGVDDYLIKPFDAAELLVRIQNLLANYQKRKHWQKESRGFGTKATLDVHFEENPESWGAEWLRQAEEIVKREIINYKYKVPDLAAEMSISKSQLQSKMKQLTGLTPNQFIREIKLHKARLLLENKAKSTIAEVAYAVGFDTPEYFSKIYENRFGKRPADYLGQ